MIERRPPAPFPFPKPASNNALDVADRFTNGRELLRINIGNFDAEFLLKRELKLNQIYGVGTEVFRKARRHSYTVRRRAELREHNLLYSIKGLFLFHPHQPFRSKASQPPSTMTNLSDIPPQSDAPQHPSSEIPQTHLHRPRAHERLQRPSLREGGQSRIVDHNRETDLICRRPSFSATPFSGNFSSHAQAQSHSYTPRAAPRDR